MKNYTFNRIHLELQLLGRSLILLLQHQQLPVQLQLLAQRVLLLAQQAQRHLVRVHRPVVQARHQHQHQQVVRPAQAQVALARQQQWHNYELR